MKLYVVGFMFNPNLDRVVLIRKNRPDWQAGKLNGVGGKIEDGESPSRAMVREFEEETGVKTVTTDWTEFGILEGLNSQIHLFRCVSEKYDDVITKTDEPVNIYGADNMHELITVPNAKWLVPMARQHDRFYTNVRYAY